MVEDQAAAVGMADSGLAMYGIPPDLGVATEKTRSRMAFTPSKGV